MGRFVCSSGFVVGIAGLFGALSMTLLGCANHHAGDRNDAGIDAYTPDACQGLACFQFDCVGAGKPETSLSGTVFAPNGTLPLYGVDVYVPATDPGPLSTDLTCDRCGQGLQGGALAQTTTDEAGKFSLQHVPATDNVPVVIQIGKWRRILKIPTVAACQDLPVIAADTTLPKSRTDMTPNTVSVDMPRIALSTGNADAMECLLPKLGIAPAEITSSTGTGRIHLYADTAASHTDSHGKVHSGTGATQFKAGWGGGTGSFTDSQTLWNTFAGLKNYDIVMLSCEGDQYSNTKSQGAMDALKQYADMGGRVFASHWHNIWIEGSNTDGGNQAPAVWTTIATWNNSGTTFNSPPYVDNMGVPYTDPPDLIDEVNNPKGPSFATWMDNVGASPAGMHDVIPILAGKQTATGIDLTKGERWVYWVDAASTTFPQNFQFTTPNEMPADQRCGKVVFSDMHVSSGSSSPSGAPGFPNSCDTGGLSPQEKALAFMFFDIASCVQPLQ